MKSPLTRAVLVGVAAVLLAVPSGAGELAVAAASDLTYAFQDIAARFEKETGNTVRLTFGSSGNFFAQIQNGAPFDLFFSADLEYAQKLEASGAAERGSLYPYAAGKIVLWVPAGSRLDVSRGLEVLLDPAVRKIAIANPKHAPYGRAAVAAMKHERIYDQVAGKLIFGENISQAAHFIDSGNADAGIVALALALGPMKARGRYFEIPATAYPPLEQGAVVVSGSHNKALARQFLEFLRKPEIVELMRRYGFAPAAK